jgi:diguanylate cyclase (GGDEF)-like protein
MSAHESLPHQRGYSPQLQDYVTNPAIMQETERLLAGRTRDIKLSGPIAQAFRDRSWRQTAKIVRAWMIWVVVLELLTLSINMFLLPATHVLPMLVPGAIIPVAAATIYAVWSKRRSDWILGWSLSAGMFCILLAVCLMGVAAGGPWHERYLNVMVFVAIAGITTFSIPMLHIGSIAIGSLALYLVFQLQNPLATPQDALSTFLFFASGVIAVVVARRTMTILARKAFLLELRDSERLLALTEANKRLDRLSKIDPLTGMANRRWMSELLTALANHPRELRGSTAILMCDIDYFKNLNDRLGHNEGDRCLAQVAAIIENSVRGGSDHVARYGGEEFLAILPDTTGDEALFIAERIRQAVHAASIPNPGSGISPFVTISIGATIRDSQTDWTPDELQWEADSALYQAKADGRNAVRLFSASKMHTPAASEDAAPRQRTGPKSA